MVSFSLLSNTPYGENKRARLNSLRNQVTEILTNNLLLELTDHSVTHSDNLTELVEKLAAPLTKTIIDDEAFLLYAACYLHDIGQQYEQANSTQIVTGLGLSPSWEDMNREQRGEILRKYHNLISAEMVMASVQAAHPPIGFQLDNEDYPHLIAALCEAHILYMDGKDAERYQSLMQCSVANVRMALLSGLLRVADILDESQKRARRVTASTRILPVLSQAHWYRHYYTQSVDVDVSSGKITLNFLFPQSKRDRYSAIILKLSLPEIKDEIFRHRTAFAPNGLNWYVVDNVDKNPYGNAEEMPENVEQEMLRLVQEKERRELQTALQSNLNDYEAAQPIIEEMMRKAAALPPDTAFATKATAWEEVANSCHRINAKHSEENALSFAFDTYGLAGEIKKQLTIGLRLIRIQYDNESFQWVQQTITECNKIRDKSQSTREEQFQLEIWTARLSGANFYSTTKDAYDAAITTAGLLNRNADKICLAVELPYVSQ